MFPDGWNGGHNAKLSVSVFDLKSDSLNVLKVFSKTSVRLFDIVLTDAPNRVIIHIIR